jgi:hypothetical protein
MTLSQYNTMCNGCFEKRAEIQLDPSTKRQSTMVANPVDQDVWKSKMEHIYLLVRDGLIMKIGGTRDGLKGRWGSYGCGYYVPQRANKAGLPYPGKMSVTNAYLYHTIENDLLESDLVWEIWSWKLPVTSVDVIILGEITKVTAQTYHAYESICIKKFKDITGKIPLLCENSDPGYK